MKISTRGRYALKIMMDLATCPEGEYISLKAISERQQVSVKYLEQIIALLSRGGMLESTRGKAGGYRLAKKPSEYTAGDILRLAEGSLAPIKCVEDSAGKCTNSAHCSTFSFWEGLNRAINDYIDSTTLADLALREREMGEEKARCEK